MFRADAGPDIGSGHVMRCLALAQAFQAAGCSTAFAMAAGLPQFESRLKMEGIDVFSVAAKPSSSEDIDVTAQLARQFNAAWVVADGYHFDATYQRGIKESGLALVAVDDFGHAAHYCADVVINQNPYARENMYRNRAPQTQLLLGARYALLRRDFRRWVGWRREILHDANRVLLTLGEGAVSGLCAHIVEALAAVPRPLEVRCLLGSMDEDALSLQKAAQASPHEVEIMRCVDDVPMHIAWADVSINGGGSTCWELSAMGAPMALVSISPDQVKNAVFLGEAGCARNMGDWVDGETASRVASTIEELLTNPKLREEMSLRGRSLIDGAGADRAAKYVLDLGKRSPVFQ